MCMQPMCCSCMGGKGSPVPAARTVYHCPHNDAGVATAFAAPIGGLLFTVEEGVSFYSTSIFWRGFLSTGIGVFTLHFLVECAVRTLMDTCWDPICMILLC